MKKQGFTLIELPFDSPYGELRAVRERERGAFTLIELLVACHPSLLRRSSFGYEGRKPWRRTTRSAFTLIELLVVIAIIAVLAALLLPALEQARGKAEVSACRSRQHQCLLGLQFYAQEWDEFPVVLDWNVPLDGQGKPPDWYATVCGWQKAAQGCGYGEPAWCLVQTGGYLAGEGTTALDQVTKCTATTPGGASHAAGNWNTAYDYFFYIAPDSCGSAVSQYGHGSGLCNPRTPIWHQNHWADSPRGYSYHDARPAGTFAIMTCRGWINRDAGHNGVIGWEPHWPQPEKLLGGGHQFAVGAWSYRERVYSYADGHNEYESY